MGSFERRTNSLKTRYSTLDCSDLGDIVFVPFRTREMAAQLGVASRATLIVEMAETVHPDTSWSVRKLMYLNMLRQCLRGSGVRCE